MHIVITLSGEGQRFLQAGYSVPKFLIEIEGRLILEHLVRLFPGEKHFTFICRPEALKKTDLRKVVQKIAPEAKILPIPPHKKGPVYSIVQIADSISDEEELLVNYCDFGMGWNYHDFLETIHQRNTDGAIVAYRGFHPHLPGTTNYGFLRTIEQRFLEAREKAPFTNNPFQEYISSGTYYFKRGALVKKYFPKLLTLPWDIHGEYYVSLVYNLMQQDQLNTLVYEVPYMLQWGTPRDLESYRFWSEYFSSGKSDLFQETVDASVEWAKILTATNLGERLRVSWGVHQLRWNPNSFEAFWRSSGADFVVFSFRNRLQTSFPILEAHLPLKIDSTQTILEFLPPIPLEQIPLKTAVDVKVWYFRDPKKFQSFFIEGSTYASEDPHFFFALGNKLLQQGFRGKAFDVDFYYPLNTPDLCQTFYYWQNFFKRETLLKKI